MSSATGAIVQDEPAYQHHGVLDRLIAIPESVPGPALLWCAVFFLVMLVVPHAILWVVGALPVGELTSYVWLPAAVSGIVVAFITLLDATARQAFTDFAPALGDRPQAAEL